jgi:MFS family permease
MAKLVMATSIGNALEWYDIAIYGYFAVYISKAFFPNVDPTISLLLTLGTFGLSFLSRPLGGVLLRRSCARLLPHMRLRGEPVGIDRNQENRRGRLRVRAEPAGASRHGDGALRTTL